MTTETLVLPEYRTSRREEDGALIIHDVEIFCSCRRAGFDFNEEWVREAVSAAFQGQGERYYPPLHVRHHKDMPGTQAPEPAGFFQVTGTKVITYKGQPRSAIMADLIVTNEYVQSEIRMGKLPYRSVEIPDIENPSIGGLALLDHEAPFLELPMLMIGGEDGVPGGTKGGEWAMQRSRDGDPVVACFSRGSEIHFLYREGPEPMTTKTKKDPTDHKADESKEPNGIQFGDGGDKKDDKKEGDSEGGGDKKPAKMSDDEDKKIDFKSLAKMIKDGSIEMGDMELLLEAIQSRQSGGEGDDAGAGAAAAPAPGAAQAMQRDTMSEQFAAILGQNQALTARVEAMEQESIREKDVNAAMDFLSGSPLGDESKLREKLVNFHRESGGNAALFKAFVESMKSAAPAVPTDNAAVSASFAAATGATSNGSPGMKMSKAVKRYQDGEGTENVDQAMKFSREYHELKGKGMMRMTEERYVKINMERLGVFLDEDEDKK